MIDSSTELAGWTPKELVPALPCLLDLLRFVTSELRRAELCFRSGMGSPEAEAAFACAEILRLEEEELERYAGVKVAPWEGLRILEALRRRLDERRPLAYILGRTWYCGHRMKIDERALIPRSAIGTMLEDLFLALPEEAPLRFLDLGTGSGSITVAFAQAFPLASFVATEIDPEALALAAENFAEQGFGERVQALESDLYGALGDQSFDWILCNPAYVSRDFEEVMTPEYRFEPDHALFGGEDGLSMVRPVLAGAAAYLVAGGQMAVEMGDITGERFREEFPEAGGEWWCHPESGNPVVLVFSKEDCQRFAESWSSSEA